MTVALVVVVLLVLGLMLYGLWYDVLRWWKGE